MRFQNGQSLIEVLIALAAATAIVAAIAVTVVTSLRNVEFTKNQNLATQYSREGLEVVRVMAKNDWASFYSFKSVSYCLSQNSTNLILKVGNTCGQNVGDTDPAKRIFVREIDINQDSGECNNGGSNTNAKVTSVVSWSDSKCSEGNPFCHMVSLETCLADINTVKTL